MKDQNELRSLQFVSKYVSLIVLKLQFLQANFEEIYQKHVSYSSWQALLAQGNQIFRANFKTWTNRQPLIGPMKRPSRPSGMVSRSSRGSSVLFLYPWSPLVSLPRNVFVLNTKGVRYLELFDPDVAIACKFTPFVMSVLRSGPDHILISP